MTHANNTDSSVTLSVLVSEAIYRAVVSVERIINRISK